MGYAAKGLPFSGFLNTWNLVDYSNGGMTTECPLRIHDNRNAAFTFIYAPNAIQPEGFSACSVAEDWSLCLDIKMGYFYRV